MKRPFAVTGFTSFAVLLFLALLERADIAFCALAGFTVAAICTLLIKSCRQSMTLPWCFFSAGLACLLFLSVIATKTQSTALAGENVFVEAEVCQSVYFRKNTGRHYAVMKILSLSGENPDGKIRLSFSETNDGISADELSIGDKVSFYAKVYIPQGGNSGAGRYFTGENIIFGAYGARDFTLVSKDAKSIMHLFEHMRNYVSRKMQENFGVKISGVLTAMLTGDKTSLDDGLYKTFRDSGIAHMMAVSGLHLSVWVYFFSDILSRRRRFAAAGNIFLILVVIFIMLIAGMSESVTRAGFMAIINLAGKLISRNSDGLNNLGLAVFLMILYNPSAVLSVSLQLSFLATLAILTLGSFFTKRTSEIFGGAGIVGGRTAVLKSVIDFVGISFSVMLFTLPVMAYAFGGISKVSLPVNFLLSPVVTPLLLLSGVCVILSPLDFAVYPFSAVVKILAEYVVSVAEFFTRRGNAFLPFDSAYALLWLGASGFIAAFGICFIRRGKRLKKLLAFILCVLSLSAVFAGKAQHKGVAFLRVDSIDSLVICTVVKDSCALISESIPFYEKEILISRLENEGVADLLILSEDDTGKSVNYGKTEFLNGVEILSVSNGTEISLNGTRFLICGKDALQNEEKYDIIIKTDDADSEISIGDERFFLSDEGGFSFVVSSVGDYVLRGENSWRSLMKSN